VNQAAVAVGVQPVLADTKAAAKGVDRKATANEALQGKVMPTNMIRSFFGRSPLTKAPMSNFWSAPGWDVGRALIPESACRSECGVSNTAGSCQTCIESVTRMNPLQVLHTTCFMLYNYAKCALHGSLLMMQIAPQNAVDWGSVDQNPKAATGLLWVPRQIAVMSCHLL